MQYDDFLDRVKELGGMQNRADADHAARAVLKTLADHLTRGEILDLRSQVPSEFHDVLSRLTEEGEAFPLEEFFDRVARLEHIPPDTVVIHSRAVVGVLREAVSRGEMADVFAQLPDEYDYFFREPNPNPIPVFHPLQSGGVTQGALWSGDARLGNGGGELD